MCSATRQSRQPTQWKTQLGLLAALLPHTDPTTATRQEMAKWIYGGIKYLCSPVHSNYDFLLMRLERKGKPEIN